MTLSPRSGEEHGHTVAGPDPHLLTMIEKAIKTSDLPPKKAALRKAVPRHTAPRAFEAGLDHLEPLAKSLSTRKEESFGSPWTMRG